MTYNSANRKDVRRLEKQAKLDENARLETIRALMGTMNGRQWAFGRLAASHIFVSSFSTAPLEMAFREGERNAGLQLLNDIMAACPDEYVQMMREANVRSTLSEQRGSQDGNGGDQGPHPAPDESADDPELDAF